jgi:hypothetical protein
VCEIYFEIPVENEAYSFEEMARYYYYGLAHAFCLQF